MATYGSYKRIKTDGILDNAVSQDKFVDDAITTAKIANSSVTSSKIASNAVDASALADNSVGTSQLASTLDLSGKTVTYRDIIDGDIDGGAAIATSKLSGAISSIPSNGLATSAFTDTTNASNISSGTLASAQGGVTNVDIGFKQQGRNQQTGSATHRRTWGVNPHQSARDFLIGASNNTFTFTDNARVTVYQSGMYIALCEIIPYQNSGQMDMFYRKNGSNMTDFRGGSSITNHAAVSGRLTVQMNSGDYLEVWCRGDNGSHQGWYTSWSFAKLGGWA